MNFFKKTKSLLTVLSLFFAAAIVGCSPSSSSQVPVESNSSEDEEAVSEEVSLDDIRHPEFNNGKNAIGVTNYRQVFETMQAVTKIPASESNDIRTAFTNNLGSFPATNSTAAFNSSQALAVTGLAYEFCNVLSQNRDYRVELLGEDYQDIQNPEEQFGSEAQRRDLVLRLTDAFWGPLPNGATAGQEETRDGEVSIVANLISELMANLGAADDIPDSRQGSELILTAACTAALGSAKTILF